MQQIDKSKATLPASYQAWINAGTIDNKDFRSSYDDIVMSLYKCQQGLCAYTEMSICIPELYADDKWANGKHTIPPNAACKRDDHFGELEHFDPQNKKVHYWNWDNLFMIESKINSIKSNKPVHHFLKPDLPSYEPEKYFDYDENTHQFIPNTDIEDAQMTAEIKYMIDEILCLNHGVVKRERENYLNELKDKQQRKQPYSVDRFFTSVKWSGL